MAVGKPAVEHIEQCGETQVTSAMKCWSALQPADEQEEYCDISDEELADSLEAHSSLGKGKGAFPRCASCRSRSAASCPCFCGHCGLPFGVRSSEANKDSNPKMHMPGTKKVFVGLEKEKEQYFQQEGLLADQESIRQQSLDEMDRRHQYLPQATRHQRILCRGRKQRSGKAFSTKAKAVLAN